MIANTAPIDGTQWKCATTQYVSRNTMSTDEFASSTPVRPIVNRNTNRNAHRHATLYVMQF